MRSRLRWRILFFTVLLPALLTAGILWTVNRSVSDQVRVGIQDRLERSSLVFEHVLASRSRKLGVTAGVIVKDPRFFSILTVRASSADAQYRATIRGVAHDFAAIAGTDLFEVLDRDGHLLASVGRASSSDGDRERLAPAALAGRPVSAVIAGAADGVPLQVMLSPVRHGGKTLGLLVLGAGIGKPLAEEMRSLTHSAVTFVSGGASAGSTLEAPDERALMAAIGPTGIPHGKIFTVRASQNYLTLVRRMPRSGLEGRNFYVMQRSLDAESAFLLGIERDLLRLGALAAIAALLAGLFLAERITRPVGRLVRSAEEMEQGNFDYPLQARGRDEIAYLTNRFAEMRRNERSYVSRLQELAQRKRDFIAVASHELRMPISILNGYTELCATGTLGPLSAKQQEALDEMARRVVELERVAEAATRVAESEAPSEAAALDPPPAAVEDGATASVRPPAIELVPGSSPPARAGHDSDHDDSGLSRAA